MNALRILVVEDEPLVARDLEATLTRLGFEVSALCRTGEEALAAMNRQVPDVVLMDIQLDHGMDGVETATRLQAAHRVPIIFLTAFADESTLIRARAAQPYGYLLKPFHESELRSVVELAHARHTAMMKLQTSEDRFVSTLKSMAEGVISTDMLGVINFMNPVAEQLTGWSSGEAMGRPLHEVFRVALPNGEALEPSGLVSGVPSRTILLTDRDGRPVHIEDNTTPIRDADGSLTGIVVLFRRRDAAAPETVAAPPVSLNEALGNSPFPNLAGIVSSIADPLLALDADWRITYLNALAAGVMEERREALLGEVLWDVFPPSLHRQYYHEFSTALTHRTPASFELEHEARRAWYEVQLYPFGQGLLVLMRDITGRKQAEQHQDKLEKLESLGLLARGFAHDFNNLLTVLLGNLSLAEMRMEPDAPCLQELSAARRASLQAQNLVQQLLTFARGGVPIRQPTELGRLVREWFAEWPRRSGTEYKLEVPDVPCPAEVDRHQIRRLLSNLVRNAEQAQPHGGTVTLRLICARGLERRTEEPAEDGEFTDGISKPPAGADSATAAALFLTVEVADAGEGIDEETLPHVFEPYFTTRGESNATGLGLTVCESITKAHGGTLALSGLAEGGTLVRVHLPAAQAPEKPEAPAVPEESNATPATDRVRRILVLEDEPLIRQLIVSNLTAAGCEVTPTSEGSEAVSRYTEALLQGNRYDLVVMDLSIPNGMGGAQAMEKLRQLDPKVQAIVSSGYSDDPIMSRYADFGFRAVLPKPYQPGELRELVLNLLAEARRG
ncbi:MAG: multi-sensor hybrid histidine kinase [Verrucomicrobiales bacterium]|nr:multi-sensor hybrid histidine kinase [Verrucomicrobiales bacterium]